MIFDISDSGLGASSIPAIVTGGGQIAAGVVPAVLASSAISAAGGTVGASILGMSLGVAVPVIGAAIAGVTLAVGMFLNRNSAYFARASAATHIVDEAETLLKNNLAAWQNSDKYRSEQAQALINFNNVWNGVVQACSNPQLEDQGKNCISERSRGGKWDWFSYYYDPIANDPNVKDDPIVGGTAEQTVSSIGESVSHIGDQVSNAISNISGSSYLIPGILLLGGIWALGNIGRGGD